MDITENQIKTKTDGTSGTITIGVTEGCGAGVLSDIIMEFHKQYPQINYDIWCSNSQVTGERLLKGLCDIGVVREPFNATKFDSTPLRTEAWIVIMSKEHPLAKKESDEIELSEIANEQLIVPSRIYMIDEINSWFNEQGIKRNIICRYNTLASILPLIEHNLGIGITTESAYIYTSPEKFAYRQIVNPKRFSNLLILKRRHKIMPAPATYFWNFVQEHFDMFSNRPKS
jgi:DNA-binding transcriptional LysR family regulator